MAKEQPDEIEDMQAALRDGIERAREMVHDYERLFRGPPPATDGGAPMVGAADSEQAEPPIAERPAG